LRCCERRLMAGACPSGYVSESGPSSIPGFPRAAFGVHGEPRVPPNQRRQRRPRTPPTDVRSTPRFRPSLPFIQRPGIAAAPPSPRRRTACRTPAAHRPERHRTRAVISRRGRLCVLPALAR
jgi:hypothetical protein